MSSFTTRAFAQLAFAGAAVVAGPATAADSGGALSMLYSFPTGSPPPAVLLAAADGDFYGAVITPCCDPPTQGDSIYRMTPDGTLTTLHTFDVVADGATNADGSGVHSLSLGSDGNLYGITDHGGSHGAGTLFRMTPDGTLTTLHAFEPDADPLGSSVRRPLVRGTDGALYGLATAGGANGTGSIVRVATDGTVTDIHDFPGDNGLASVFSQLFSGAGGTVYFTSPVGDGALNTVTPLGAVGTVYSFSSTGGVIPSSLVQADDGTFYGVIPFASSGEGLGPNAEPGRVVEFTAAGAVTTLHAFDGLPERTFFQPLQWMLYHTPLLPRQHISMNAEGGAAWDSSTTLRIGADGNLYGLTDTLGGFMGGTLFRLTPDGVFTTLFAFGDKVFQPPIYDNDVPPLLLDDGDGHLIGAAQDSDSVQYLTITPGLFSFAMAPAAPLAVTATFSPAAVAQGQPATLSWSSAGARSCSMAGDVSGFAVSLEGVYAPKLPIRPVATHGSRQIGTAQLHGFEPAVFVATVQCKDADGRMANATAKLTVTASPTPSSSPSSAAAAAPAAVTP